MDLTKATLETLFDKFNQLKNNRSVIIDERSTIKFIKHQWKELNERKFVSPDTLKAANKDKERYRDSLKYHRGRLEPYIKLKAEILDLMNEEVWYENKYWRYRIKKTNRKITLVRDYKPKVECIF